MSERIPIMSRSAWPRSRRHGATRSGLAALGMLALLLLGACGGGGAAPAGFDLDRLPTDAALLALPSDSGNLQLSMWTAPQPAVKGRNEVLYRVFDEAANPVDGLTIAVLPWMPSHGHGSAAIAEVTPLGNGYYLVSPAYLTMSGRWELRTSLTTEAAENDTAVPVVDIP